MIYVQSWTWLRLVSDRLAMQPIEGPFPRISFIRIHQTDHWSLGTHYWMSKCHGMWSASSSPHHLCSSSKYQEHSLHCICQFLVVLAAYSGLESFRLLLPERAMMFHQGCLCRSTIADIQLMSRSVWILTPSIGVGSISLSGQDLSVTERHGAL